MTMSWTQTDAHNLRRALAGLNPRNTVARPSAADTAECLAALLDKAAKAIHGKPGRISDEQLDTLRLLVDDLYRVEAQPGPAVQCMSWDYRQIPDLDRLAQILRDVSGGAVTLQEVDDGSDDIVIALARRPLGDGEALAAWEASR